MLIRTRSRRARLALFAAVAACIVLLLVFVGRSLSWLVSWDWQRADAPVVTGEVTGTVDVVNAAGTKVCLTPSGGGDQVCSGLWLPTDGRRAAPSVGDTLSVWIIRLPAGKDVWVDQFVAKPAGS